MTTSSQPINLEQEFTALIEALERADVAYAVVGALAVAIWGAPRATTDIDLLVVPEDVDAAITVAKERGFAFEALPMTFRDGMVLRRVSMLRDGDVLTLDLILVNESLRSVWESRCVVHTDAGPIFVVSREALIAMKTAAGRAQDLGDIQRLNELDR